MTPFLLVMAAQATGYGVRCAELHDMTLLAAPVESVTAQSTLSPASRYGAPLALDGDLNTAWCEGVSGNGEGQTLKVGVRVK